MKKILSVCFLMIAMLLMAKAQVPSLNLRIVAYASSQVGKKVDRGECWDLAYEALTQNHCAWDHKYVYGKKLDPKTDSIYAGDLLQFENVTVKYKNANMSTTEEYPHHTAIIYQVLGKNHYTILHQNFGSNSRKVMITDLDLTHKTSGKISFYRPVEAM